MMLNHPINPVVWQEGGKLLCFGQKDSDVHFYTYYIYIFFEYMSDYWTSH